MDEIREKHTVIHDHPAGSRPVVEHQYEQVVEEPRGVSGGAIAAIVISAILATAMLTWFIVSNQQQNRDQEMAIERERTLAAERSAAQPQTQQPQQQPNVVILPQQQPQTVPVPVPVPVPSQTTPDPATTAPSNTSIEISLTQKFLDDSQLKTYTIDAKADSGVITLSGEVPTNELKMRAEKLATTVKGVRRVTNNITVRDQ